MNASTTRHPIRNRERRREYDRHRGAGWDCGRAKYAADALYVFRKLEDAGLARFRVEPDSDGRWALEYLDDPFYRDTREGRALAKLARETAERDGVWGLICEYRLPFGREYDPDTGEGLTDWEHADSVWGMVGFDMSTDGADHCGYLGGFAAECLAQFKAAYRAMLANNR